MLLCTTLLLLISFLVHATPLDQPHRTLSSSKLKPRHYDSAINAAHAKRQGNPILRASFTSNPTCGQTISCNAGKYNTHTGVKGIGATAVNGMLFGGAPGVYDGSSGYKNVNGVGGACGSCWTLTPGYNYHESNGKSLGHTVVVRINDACTDKGYCDQSPAHPLNTGPLDKMQPSGKYDGQVHFDLCQATGVSAAFFGATNGGLNAGVAIGAAQYNPDCTGLEDGNFGGSTVSNLAMPFDMPGGQSQGTATDNKPVEHGTQAQKGKKSQQKQEFNTTTDAADGAQPEKSEELPVMGGSQSQTNTTDPATNPSGQGIEQQQQKGPTSQQKQELGNNNATEITTSGPDGTLPEQSANVTMEGDQSQRNSSATGYTPSGQGQQPQNGRTAQQKQELGNNNATETTASGMGGRQGANGNGTQEEGRRLLATTTGGEAKGAGRVGTSASGKSRKGKCKGGRKGK